MIGSSENRISYNGNGIATEFAYTFKILEKSDMKVLHVAADGTETLLVSDYYVDMDKSVVLYPGYAPGAEIPEQNRPPILPKGERLVLYREVPITQESALDKHWPFNVIENGLDKLTIICQQIWDRLQRSFYVSESTSTNFDPKVPIEAGKTFRVKDDGTGFEVTEDPGKVIDGATALLKQTTEQAEFANEAATNAQNAANTAEKIANDLGLVDEAVQTAVASAEQATSGATTASDKADVATAKADIATTKASEASTSADTATQKADAANTSATNAAQSYANADAIAAQLTEYLATKETLTAPAVDKTLLIEGAAADSKVVGELKRNFGNYYRIIQIAPSETGEYWNINIDCQLKANEKIRFRFDSYQGDGFIRARLIAYDSLSAQYVLDNEIKLGDDKEYNILNDCVRILVQIVASSSQVGNSCDFTIIESSKGIARDLWEINNRIDNDVVLKNGTSGVDINNTTFFETKNKYNLGVGYIDGYVLNANSPVANSNYFYTNPLYNIIAGQTYVVSIKGVSAYQIFITSWGDNDAYINNQTVGTYDGMSKKFTIPSETKYIRVSADISNKNLIQIEKGEESTAYEEFGTVAHATVKIDLNDNSVPHIFRVEKDGSGDYIRLINAIEEAEKFMDSKVYIGAGTWDLIEELGPEYVESCSSTQRGIYLKNRVHLIGSSESLVTCHYTGDNSSTKTWLSAFNSGEYGFTLENLRIESSNCRYTMHDERDTSIDSYHNKYINCIMKHNNESGGNRQVIGGGLGKNGHIVIHGCIFESVTADNNSAVSYHNTWYKGGTGKSFIDIQGNIVKGTGTFRFSWFGDSVEMTQIICANNSVGSDIQFVQETAETNLGVSVDIVNMELHKWNNEVRSN